MADTTTTISTNTTELKRDSSKTVILASLIGTTIEFFDFNAYGISAATYFPKVFFPELNATIAMLLSLLTFGVAFVARPLGSLIFGHFGDKYGRKETLVISLLLMGLSTVIIGLLPGFATIGGLAIVLLCLCRFIQGIGLGGEWSGAVLVATENAPKNRRALYGSFPELGSPIGFFLCNGLFIILETQLTPAQMLSFGWRIPFLSSAILVIIGLWTRARMQETPLYRLAQKKAKVVKSPLAQVFKSSWRQILQGSMIMAISYTLFFLLSTWSLSYGTAILGFSNREWMTLLMSSILVFAVTILASAIVSDKIGRRKILFWAMIALIPFSFVFPYLLQTPHNLIGGLVFLMLGFFLMGLIYGPVGAVLPELFPTNIRYSGAGISYNLSAIIGAAFAPTIASYLAHRWGIHAVGIYLLVMVLISLVALLTTKETQHVDYTK